MIQKIILMLIFSLIISNFVNGQDSECDLLNKGVKYYEEEKLDSAIITWKSVVQNYPDTSDCYGRSFNNIPLVYAQLKQMDNAKKWFKKILNSSLNDLSPGMGIMRPYANYKHNACLRLSDVYRNEKNYEKSLEYVKLSETKFPYQTFSATSFEKRAVVIAFKKAELFLDQNKKKEALYIMLHKVLDVDVFFRKTDAASFTNVNFYSGLIEELLPLIEEIYGFEDFKEQIKKSIKELKVEKTKIGKEQSKAKIAFFSFDNMKFKIGSSNKKITQEDFVKRLNNNLLFQVLDKK